MTDNPLDQIREHSKSINGSLAESTNTPINNSLDDLTKDLSLAQAADESIQPRARGETEVTGLSYLFSLRGGGTIAPWWIPRRDKDLRAFVVASDHLKGATYNFITRLAAIPFIIIPRNKSIARHVREAKEWQQILEFTPELFAGYRILTQKILADYLGTDNGLFMEIVAPGEKDTPIVGGVTTVNHLDSVRCVRTNNPEFPVIYEAPRGGRFKLHYSRVALASQLPSADEEMNGVGICAVSRCLDAAQNLLDMDVFRQEKLGSRPGRAVIVASGGLSPKIVGSAISQAALAGDARGLTRYSMVPVVGSPNLPDGALDIVDLSSIPDGFNFKDATDIGMAIIALAFGVDARELFPSTGVGATRADALIQHVKQRGKGFADVIKTLEHIFNNFVLPEYLEIIYDFQDDAQDRQEAEIQSKRSETRQRDLEDGVTTIRVERLRMVEKGEISEDEFIEMELQDGRLPNGLPVLTLFADRDPAMSAMLVLPNIPNPLDIATNDAVAVIAALDKQEGNILVILGTANSRDQQKARMALAAIQDLRREYQDIVVGTSASLTTASSNDTDEMTLEDDEERLLANELDTGNDLSDEKSLVTNGENTMNMVDKLFNFLDNRDKQRLLTKIQTAQSTPNERSVLDAVQGIIAAIPDKPPINMNFDLGKSFGEMVSKTVSATIKEVLQNMPMPNQPVVEFNPQINLPEQPAQEIIVQLPDNNKSLMLELPQQIAEQFATLIKQQSEPVINISVPEQPAPTVNVNVPEGAIQLSLPDMEDIDIRRDAQGEIIGMTKRRSNK